jgi:DNA-binding response OmpR family regulator
MREGSPTVLVVDDDPDLRALLTAVLDAQGIQVLTARNGMEGFALACLHRPALIVLDLEMPVMTGEDFRRVQLDADVIQQIPVLVLSARDDASRVAERLNAVAFLAKPVDVERFLNCVRPYTAA